MTVSAPGTTSQVVGLCVSAASSFRRGEATGLRVLALPGPLAVDEGAVDFGVAVGIFEGGGGAGIDFVLGSLGASGLPCDGDSPNGLGAIIGFGAILGLSSPSAVGINTL